MSRRAPSRALSGTSAASRALWVLNGLPHATARDLEQWLDEIGEFPLDAWLRVAERCIAADQGSLLMTRACARVERAIADQGLEFTAWLVRDLVETATHQVRHTARRQPRQVRARLTVARIAAEWAGLAKACQPWLSPDDSAMLCAPFSGPSERRASAAV